MLILNYKKNNYIAGSKTIKIKQIPLNQKLRIINLTNQKPKQTQIRLRTGCHPRLPNLTSFPMQKSVLLQYSQDLMIQLFAQR